MRGVVVHPVQLQPVVRLYRCESGERAEARSLNTGDGRTGHGQKHDCADRKPALQPEWMGHEVLTDPESDRRPHRDGWDEIWRHASTCRSHAPTATRRRARETPDLPLPGSA